jgi:XTP/dITP diphosphohydrolase
MTELVFASGNAHKVQEVQALLHSSIHLTGLSELGIPSDLPETSDTLELNAMEKARFVYGRTGRDCFADDTGLEVRVLNGAPGVHSARYAGEAKDMAANRRKLMSVMQGVTDRSACFRTVICLILRGKEYLFEGKVEGRITEEESGDEGFGYDALFVPEGFSRSFAEMEMWEKNTVSHRSKAVKAMEAFLVDAYNPD